MSVLEETEIENLKLLANSKLSDAKKIWNKVGHEMKNFSRMAKIASDESLLTEAVESNIPGYQFIASNEPLVDDFIAIVADMRNSTEHLRQHMQANNDSGLKPLQRAFYETSMLLPCLAKAISYKNGQVTEYLGDGVLGFFRSSDKYMPKCIYNALHAAEACFEALNQVINPILKNDLNLPPLSIGIGLAKSKAIVHIVGVDDHLEGKLFGECVYYATKLSGEDNRIVVDECLRLSWPKEKNGPVSFCQFTSRSNVKGYYLNKK